MCDLKKKKSLRELRRGTIPRDVSRTPKTNCFCRFVKKQNGSPRTRDEFVESERLSFGPVLDEDLGGTFR